MLLSKNKNQYESVVLTDEQKIEVEIEVGKFVDENAGDTDDEKLVNFGILKSYLHQAIDYVNPNLSYRVDGASVAPILKSVCEERASKIEIKEGMGEV